MRQVRFSTRFRITADAVSPWERTLFEATFFEYRLQAQRFEGFTQTMSFAEFLKLDKAEEIHARISPAAHPAIRSLHSAMPNFTDALGEPILIQQFRLKLLDSHFSDRERHQVLVEFFSPRYLLIEALPSGFILAETSLADELNAGAEIQTLFIPMQAGLTISHYQLLP